MQPVSYLLGLLLTAAGVGLLVVAYRHGAAGRVADERRTFRLAVAALAAGSLVFLVTTVVLTPRP